MKLEVPAKSFKIIEGLLSADEAAKVLAKAKSMDDSQWIRRTRMAPGRAMPGEGCLYDFSGINTYNDEILNYLIQFAPEIEGYELDEVCINRYLPGHYIGKHIDKGHPVNMVISLETNDKQGCLVGDTLLTDVQGRAVVHPAMSAIHSVPTVETERYVLIYLYSFAGALQCRHATIRSSASHH